MATITVDAAWNIALTIGHLRYRVTDLVWVRRLAFDLFFMWKRTVELGARQGVCALRIESSYFDIDPDDKITMEVAGWTAACAQHGLLIDRSTVDHQAVSQCLDLARHLLPAMPEISGALTRRLDEVAVTVRERAAKGDQEATVIDATLTKGLERIRNEAGAHAAEFNRGYRDATPA